MNNRFRFLPNYRYYEAEGQTLSLGKTAGRPLRDYRIYGNSIQRNTPSGDNPADILSVGDFDDVSGKYIVPVSVNDTIYKICLDEPLRGLGEYSDVINLMNRNITRNITKYTFTNSSYIVQYNQTITDTDSYYFYIRDYCYCLPNCDMYSNVFDSGNYAISGNSDKGIFSSKYSSSPRYSIYGQINKSLVDSLEGDTVADKIRKYLVDNNAYVIYATTQPTEEDVSLPVITTEKHHTNIIEVDTEVPPSKLWVQYYK